MAVPGLVAPPYYSCHTPSLPTPGWYKALCTGLNCWASVQDSHGAPVQQVQLVRLLRGVLEPDLYFDVYSRA